MQKNSFGYPIEFVDDAFGESPVLADLLKSVSGSATPRVLIVADLNVVQRNESLGSKIGRYVQAHGIVLAGSPVVISGGEKVKADNLQSALRVVSALLEAKLGRTDVVLAIGGGTLLDVAGYAAAQVRGGIRLVRLPTTPAAMMGAAFADYAAVDSTNVKDALRVPSVPAAVIIDITFAHTVLDGVWRGGIGEAVRQAVSVDAALWKKLVKLANGYRNREIAALKAIVEAVVASYSKKGLSRFAEWSALRLETMSGYKLPHGYALAIGLVLDLDFAVKACGFPSEDRDAVVALLETCGALDGLHHSQHLLGQKESLLAGLDAWALSAEETGIVLPSALGKSAVLEPNRAVYAEIFASRS